MRPPDPEETTIEAPDEPPPDTDGLPDDVRDGDPSAGDQED